MFSTISDFVASRSGASAAEYALILGLISVAIIAGATVLGTAIAAPITAASAALAP